MARLPIYTQQTRPQGTQVSPQDMGAGVGVAMQDMGNTLTDIGVNIQRRNDVLESVRGFSAFDQEAMTTLEVLNSTEDIANPQTINSYRQGLDQTIQKTLENYQGSRIGRQKLQAQLENQKSQYVKSAMAAQIKAQHSMIGRQVDQKVNELGVITALAPDQYESAITDFEATLTQLSDAIPQDQLENYREIGRSKIASSVISGLLERGDFKNARMMLTDPNVGKFVPPEVSRRFAMGIAVDEAKAVQAAVAVQNHINQWQSFAGRTLTPDEINRVKGLPLPKPGKKQTAAQKIAEYEIITGKTAPQAVIDRIFAGEVEGPDYGKSLRGLAMSRVEGNMDLYLTGQMTPEELRRFQADVNAAYAPINRKDPDSGAWVTEAPSIPPAYLEAFERGAQLYGGSIMAGQPAVSGIGGAGGGSVGAMGAGEPAQPQSRLIGAVAPQPGEPSIEGQTGQTVWDMAGNVAGPWAGIRSVASSMPIVGDLPIVQETANRVTEQRRTISQYNQRLIRSLMEGARFTATEAERVSKEANIDPSSFTSQSEYYQRLAGIDTALARRVEEYQEILNKPETSTTSEERQKAMAAIPIIQQFRETLGVPPRVDDTKQLPDMIKSGAVQPGQPIMLPDGKVRQAPPLIETRSQLNRMLEEGQIQPGDQFVTPDGRVLVAPRNQ